MRHWCAGASVIYFAHYAKKAAKLHVHLCVVCVRSVYVCVDVDVDGEEEIKTSRHCERAIERRRINAELWNIEFRWGIEIRLKKK